jgi:WD40 repeat protein
MVIEQYVDLMPHGCGLLFPFVLAGVSVMSILHGQLFRLDGILRTVWAVTVAGLLAFPAAVHGSDDDVPEPAGPVSFYRQVRPILQRHCSGCHQPAKPGGKLVLTSYADFKKGGEGGASFEAGQPDESLILDYITGDEPLMPQNADPLPAHEIELIARWIEEGAQDDTPEGVQDTISAANPPVYASPPVITALAYSPDSQLLAVSGFHEILLHKADASGLVGRLVGRSQRIESLAFSPDGKLLGAVGGTPALFGEVQFWNVEEQKLIRSESISYDTLYGASFSNDGSQFAFGGADSRARVVKVEDGQQVMQLDAHSDWVFGTTFSLDSSHLITVSRDMSMKLTTVANGQFVDNITSITPGALKGGLLAVQRHPKEEQVLTGGADGEPKLYKIYRTQARRIGDDFNRIRGYQKLPGRIFDLQFNTDGSRFVVGASTSTNGTVRVYNTEDAKLLHDFQQIESPIFAVAFRPDGKQAAAAGFDGVVRIFDVETGKLVKELLPVEITPAVAASRE